jgi:tripartite-type tricarboxylate transporter receptor subunit TctC
VGFASNYVLQSRIPFDPVKDFTAVLLVGSIPSVIVVHPSLPVKSLDEFIALARKHPDGLAFGSSGVGTGSHLAVEMFRAATRTRMTHVPYKSTAQAVPDLLAGRIQFMFDFPTTALQPIKAGKLRGIAVTSSRRTPALPDLPTVAEAGVEGYDFGTWCGVFGPAGMPLAITEKLATTLTRALGTPATRAKLVEQAIDVAPAGPQQFAQFLRSDIERWRALLSTGHLAKLD